MANRSYIYRVQDGKMDGLGESNYSIPITYKILVSQNAKLVKSKLFEDGDEPDTLLAIQGDFRKGKEKLYQFMDKLLSDEGLCTDEIRSQISETKSFFDELDGEYTHLESGEVLAMDDEPMSEQISELFNEVKDIDRTLERFYESFRALVNKYHEIKNTKPYTGLFAKRRNEKLNQELERIKGLIDDELWFDSWSHILFYDFSEAEN